MELSLDHYARVIFHRKWLVLGVFLIATIGTVVFSSRIPDVYTSDTVIMVDPQKVPETYVRSTVTGDVRNRSGHVVAANPERNTSSEDHRHAQSLLRRQKDLAREDVISRMRKDISVSILSEFGASQELQAFRIGYSGKEPGLSHRSRMNWHRCSSKKI